MRPISIAFAAALMLGGMSAAYAQDGPGKDRESTGQTQSEQGKSQGAERGQAESRSDRGSNAEKSESRASGKDGDDRSARKGEGNEGSQGEQRSRDEKGERTPRQAQEGKQDGKDGSASKERESRKDEAGGKAQRGDRDEDRKAAERRESGDQDKAKRAQSREDEEGQRAGQKDRAGTQKDDDAKRAESRERQDRDGSKSADRKEGERDHKAARVELQGGKKEKVQSAFREHSGSVKERTNVNIDISVGRALPGDWEYYPLPSSIVEIVPEYRGYRYVYVDGRYVIVEPRTHEVVTVISAGGGGHASAAGRGHCAADLALSSSDREYLLKSVQMRNEADVSGVSIGWHVPDSVELQAFPGPVTKRISGLSSCRYFVVNDRIAIVDPAKHNVVILVQD